MAVYSVQNNTAIVVTEINTVLNGDFYRIVYLHIYIVVIAPTPSPTIFILVKDGSGRNHGTVALKIHGNFIQLTLYLVFIVPCGLDVDFYVYPIRVPRGDI
jgi:hypothetical protein